MFFTNQIFGAWSDIVVEQSAVFVEGDQYIHVEVRSNFPAETLLEINGGQIGSLFVYDSSQVILRNGEVNFELYSFHPENNDGDDLFFCPPKNNIKVCDTSHLYLYGGFIKGNVLIYENALVDIYGYNFEMLGRNELTGFWQNGTTFSFRLVDSSFDRVNLHIIPEPLSFGFLCFGVLLLRRK